MTVTQFISFIKEQPWQFQYISNFLNRSHPKINAQLVRPISEAFTWNETPEGWEFWDDIDNRLSHQLLGHFGNFDCHDLEAALLNAYSESHPELFIWLLTQLNQILLNILNNKPR